MRGSWDLGGSGIAASTACGRTTALPSGTHVRNFRSVLEHASIRSPSRDYIYHISSTESHVQHFRSVFEHASIRSPSWKTHQLFVSGRSSNGTASMGTRFSVRVIAYERHFRCRASAHSSNFLERHHARATSELAVWRSSFSFFLFLFCMVLYHVKISTVLLLPDQHKPL